jgi:hypothetical protein
VTVKKTKFDEKSEIVKQLTRIADALEAQAKQDRKFKEGILKQATPLVEQLLRSALAQHGHVESVTPVRDPFAASKEPCVCGHEKRLHVLETACAADECDCVQWRPRLTLEPGTDLCAVCLHGLEDHDPNSNACVVPGCGCDGRPR